MDASMTADQYRHIIVRLGLSQIAAARLLGVDERTSRRWANDERDIPAPAVRFLQYLIATKKTGEQATKVLDTYTQIRGW
jgi:DNA-binding transcriptional regulator YiaG